jgi:hypothetical protein
MSAPFSVWDVVGNVFSTNLGHGTCESGVGVWARLDHDLVIAAVFLGKNRRGGFMSLTQPVQVFLRPCFQFRVQSSAALAVHHQY